MKEEEEKEEDEGILQLLCRAYVNYPWGSANHTSMLSSSFRKPFDSPHVGNEYLQTCSPRLLQLTTHVVTITTTMTRDWGCFGGGAFLGH